VPDHDALYHRLFSHPGLVAELLRGFVDEPWIADLDLDGMERVNTKFHSQDNDRREGDVIWRIPLKRGGDAYLLLLLEFQSAPDRWMALRAMVYTGLLWQQIVAEKRLTADGRLPPVFPLVLYNGDRRWEMPLALESLIDLPADSPLWRWQPMMRYNVIGEGGFSNAGLAARDTLAALLFRLESVKEPEQIGDLIGAVVDWFKSHAGFEPLMPLFGTLAARVVAMAEGGAPGFMSADNMMEARTMLLNRPAEWRERWQQEGLKKGRLESQVSTLTRLLERRFGLLPATVHERIAAADSATPEEWTMRILDAGSIDDVLA
jgi:hypothetical protein